LSFIHPANGLVAKHLI